VSRYGTGDTRLIVIREIRDLARLLWRALRCRLGRGWALVEQDYLRRTILWEHDVPGAVNIGLISHAEAYAKAVENIGRFSVSR
jgi:hypothetical protein